MRTRKTRIGSSVLLATAVLLLCLPAGLAAKDAKKDKRKALAPFALIAGTVYRPPGFALPGAQVKIEPEQEQAGGEKLKAEKVSTDNRGEFAVRVPTVPAKWRVNVQIKGYRPDQKSVAIEGEQRVDLSFVLEPVADSKEGTK